MDATGTLALRSDVLLIPVTELDSRTRQSIGCDDEDVAISRPQSRMPSTVVDAGAAALIEQFRTPRTLVEAVMLFAAPRRLDPAVVLEDAYRLVRQMVEQGVLVAPEAAAGPPTEGGLMLAQYRRGDLVGDVEVVRALQVVEDAEIYVARHPSAGACVLKVQRTGAHASVTHLGHEAQVLARLAGHAAPALIACDVVDDRVRLLMEHCRGVEAEFAAAECRSLEADALTRMLSLLRHIARAYAVLHAHGVCHGDVHPRNVLVDAHLGVRVIDFGLASLSTAHGAEPTSPPRGGIAFFSEPEAARALLDGQPCPPVTMTGEQYSVAALLFYLLTGGHHVDFSLGRQELLQEIATAPPVTFAARGLPAWPDLEACLQQALSKEPDARFPSMDAFADALDAVAIPALATGMPAAATATPRAALRAAADAVLADTALEASWFVDGLSQGPTASLNYGAAGVAWALARVAQIRQDAALLARADAWACRARLLADTDPAAFLNPGGEITPESVGTFTPLHTMSGVAAVEALVAWMRGDDDGHHRAVAAFITAVQNGMTADEGQADVPAMQLDLALGRGSVLVGAGQLLQTLPRGKHPLRRALTSVGDEQLAVLWRVLDDTPPIAESRYDNLGMAHGWAGFLHATLQWCHDTGHALPRGVVPRLEQLAALAEPSGRGLVWPWTLVRGTEANYMPGWCNGSAGYVHLWTRGAHVLHDTSYEVLAEGAAWDVWDAQDAAGTLCCGLAGRAYALLAMHRHGGDAAWLERAGILGERAAHGRFEDDYPHSLYKGRMVLPVLAADLDHPFGALHPCFALPLTPA
jgi:serine/threonine-protein kinase